ncbi:MAG: 16S rRNA methyltransferase [Candidatus Peregrinibacteria bacterium GW2011_GWC2_39_14]|nr:MAG: Ribosomal RNA small subunit methyltransferase I [Candidatus Peregrinibacteria bacterium GW2011_GWA2_38_36]KKR06551.1 MAG: 16S rRNA methyltransferase [Candidatus Peregrinibacteria bacterium GW2011_GWC2_39_14]
MKGTLYIVATPIGNLEDITLRAIRTLKEVDYIAAEDTRHSKILLDKYEIKTQQISFHSYSDDHKLAQLIQLLDEGRSIALITDAGTPGISDPAYKLIQAALQSQINLVPIPGASAFLTALSVSGLHMHSFVYYGFLPLKKGRQTLFNSWLEEERAIIFYESPHRIVRTLEQIQGILEGGANPSDSSDIRWRVVIARELTKMYEEVLRGSFSEIITHFRAKAPKGEFVVLLQKA